MSQISTYVYVLRVKTYIFYLSKNNFEILECYNQMLAYYMVYVKIN